MPKNFGLGRGLGSLIPVQPDKIKKFFREPQDFLVSEEKILQIEPNHIERNPHQPRQNIEHHDLEELIESIKIYGIIQPLIVTKTDNGYQLIAGERRLKAAQILGLKTVPAIARQVQDVEQLEIALIENIQRKDLNPIEQALAYRKLIDEFNLTQEDVAQKIGKSRSGVGNTLRLLSLPEEIQKSLAEEKITEGHAKAILAVDNPNQQLKLFRKIIFGGLTVRDVEKETKRAKLPRSQIIKDLKTEQQEKELREKLGTKVIIKKSGKHGKIIIDFYSEDDLKEIIAKIK